MKRKSDLAGTIIVIAVLVYFLIATYGAWHNCNDAGGTLVRGVFWYECVP